MARPKLFVARTRPEHVMQVLAAGAVIALLVHAASVWPALPATVPTHFDFSGAPDGWGSRASLLALPAIATVFFFVLSWLERMPHAYNYPVEITPANAPRVYALGRRLVLALKLILVGTFGAIFGSSVQVASGEATALPRWLLPAVVGAIVLTTGVTCLQMRSARAEPRR